MTDREKWLSSEAFTQALLEHFKLAVEDAIDEHRREGRAIPIYIDGKLTYLQPYAKTSDNIVDAIRKDGKANETREEDAYAQHAALRRRIRNN